MPGLECEIDANFFCMVHELLHGERARADGDRRQTLRRRMAAQHRVARFDGIQLPAADDFTPVDTYDLNRGGFSFFSDTPAEFPRLIADFGSAKSSLWVEAEVRHCELVLRHSDTQIEYVGPADTTDGVEPAEKDPRHVYLVGCRFVRRLGEEDMRPVKESAEG